MTHSALSTVDFTMPTSLAALKELSAKLGIEAIGPRTKKASFIAAITAYEVAKLQAANVVAIALEAETLAESQPIAETLEAVAVEHGMTVVEILTCPKAKTLYRCLLRAVVFIAVVACKGLYALAKELYGWATALNTEYELVERVIIKAGALVAAGKSSQSVSDLRDMAALYQPNTIRVVEGGKVLGAWVVTGILLLTNKQA